MSQSALLFAVTECFAQNSSCHKPLCKTTGCFNRFSFFLEPLSQKTIGASSTIIISISQYATSNCVRPQVASFTIHCSTRSQSASFHVKHAIAAGYKVTG
eukprot:1158787-Pelagomonas_calceolata.AAC.4